MYDLRESKIINLDDADCLKENTTFKFTDTPTGKKLIAKFISEYDDAEDAILFAEFKSLAALSGEPEIATVYYIASGVIAERSKSCYIMDFIEGDSLQDYMDKREYIAYEVLVYFVSQLASGLEKAHNFGIFHNDLHNHNIMINNLGYLKLIDFLWYEYKNADGERDIADFKRIISELYTKCSDGDKPRFKIINDYCQRITNFRGLKKEIEMLDEISFELVMLNEKQLRILSKIFSHAIDYTLQIAIISRATDIPDKFIPPLDEKEEQYLEISKKGTGIQPLDTRPGKIERVLIHILYLGFHSLKQIGLIDWKFQIINSGEIFIGPYQYTFHITLTSKLLKWKRANELLLFVNEETREIEEFILD